MVNKNYKTQLTWLFLFLFFLVSCTTIKQTGEGNDNDLRVILDTDFGPDVDDVLAVAQLHALADLNEVEIVATVHTSSHDYGPGALSALNKWHGRIVPVGAIQVDGLYNIWLGDYTQPLYETFPRYVGLRHTVDDVTDVYRSFLSQADFKITIVMMNEQALIFQIFLSGCKDGKKFELKTGFIGIHLSNGRLRIHHQKEILLM
jgi:hypothetical protein